MLTLPPTDSGFNRIAWIYDLLAFLVFGQSLRKAQMAFLDCIPGSASVLIIGGGSGWLLQKLLDKIPSVTVVYVEASVKMLLLAQQKTHLFSNTSKMVFRLGNETAIQATDHFDVVITPFFLDLFTQVRLDEIIMPRLANSLQPGGKWLFSDFVHSRYWFHQLLLKMMYWFFGKLCRIKARKLPDYAALFARYSFQQKTSRPFYGGMIESSVWEKTH